MNKYNLTDEALLECCKAISKYLEERTINHITINKINEVLISYNWYEKDFHSIDFKADLDGFNNFLRDKYRIKKVFKRKCENDGEDYLMENETSFEVKSFYKMVIKDLKLNLLLDTR